MQLKVLCITQCFPINNEDKRSLYISDSVQALHDLGVDPVVLVTKSWQPRIAKRIHSDFAFEKIDYSQFKMQIKLCRYLSIPRHYLRIISNCCYLSRVFSEIKKLNTLHHFDVIHAHGEICALAAVKAGKKFNIPVVVTIHGVDTCKRLRKGLAGKMFFDALSKANKIVYVGPSLQETFQKYFCNNDRARVIYNGVRLPIQKKTYPIFLKDRTKVNFISVSNLHEGKGIEITLMALANLKKMGVDNWIYTIIGSGNQKSTLLEMIEQFDLYKNVLFLGDLPHDAVYENLEKADIFCLPSYREAFGIAYLEAMAHGLLTIGVRGQGPESFIDHDKTGLLVEPQDIDSLTKILWYVLQNKEKMQIIADAGRQSVLEEFIWNKHGEKLIEVYREVCQ